MARLYFCFNQDIRLGFVKNYIIIRLGFVKNVFPCRIVIIKTPDERSHHPIIKRYQIATTDGTAIFERRLPARHLLDDAKCLLVKGREK